MSDKKLSSEPSMDEILTSIRRILAEDDYAVMRPPPSRDRANGDILDLTEAVNGDGSIRHISPAVLVTPEGPARPPDGRIEPVPPRPPEPAAEPQLVSNTASEAVAASFARLAAAARRDDGGEHSLDDQVREMLRPMLQAWLDAHLPELVERLVRAEIARVVGAARPTAP